MTVKALSFTDNFTAESQILDLGCGTGGQTMVLAQHSQGSITGLDLFPKFIDQFNANAAKLNLQDRVKGIVGSMDDLPFGNEAFDLIWSEGAILTDLVLTSDPFSESVCMEKCHKCIVSCPANAIENGTVNQKLCRTHTYGKTKRGFDTVDCNQCRTVCPMCYGDNGIISDPL
jgi:16S rRNA G1207 methylase RsmC